WLSGSVGCGELTNWIVSGDSRDGDLPAAVFDQLFVRATLLLLYFFSGKILGSCRESTATTAACSLLHSPREWFKS
ncbi:hypothetical protein BaRGS_00038421, partial [Batillaria attramentaria]